MVFLSHVGVLDFGERITSQWRQVARPTGENPSHLLQTMNSDMSLPQDVMMTLSNYVK